MKHELKTIEERERLPSDPQIVIHSNQGVVNVVTNTWYRWACSCNARGNWVSLEYIASGAHKIHKDLKTESGPWRE